MPIRNLRQKVFPKESLATLDITRPNELVGATKDSFWRLRAACPLEHVHLIGGGHGEKYSRHTYSNHSWAKRAQVCTDKAIVATDSHLTHCTARMNYSMMNDEAYNIKKSNEIGFSIGMLKKSDCSFGSRENFTKMFEIWSKSRDANRKYLTYKEERQF
jgi:hypothetical protein